MSNKIKILIADDHTLFRKGMRLLLSKEKSIEVIGEAKDGLEAVNLTLDLKPDILLLDIDMPKLKGDEVCKELRKLENEVKIIIVSMHEEDRYVAELLKAGANGYLLKNEEPTIVRRAVLETYKEGHYFNERTVLAMRKIISEDMTSELTVKENEVLQLICEEFTTKQIAKKLDLSEKTIEVYRKNILQKTNSKNVAGIVKFAFKNNLIQ